MTYEFQEYPKWVGDVIVHSREEEAELHKEKVPEPDTEPKKRTRKAKE
jgi:hypothetical protein